MIRFEKTIEIDAPIEQVFAYLVDPAHMPEYMVGTDAVNDIQRLPDGRATYTLVGKFLGLHVDFKTEQVEVIPNERIVDKSHGGGMDYTASTYFERSDGGRTRTRFVAECALHAGPLAKFGEAFFARYFAHGMEMSMEAGKAHIESRIPAATPH